MIPTAKENIFQKLTELLTLKKIKSNGRLAAILTLRDMAPMH